MERRLGLFVGGGIGAFVIACSGGEGTDLDFTS